MKLQDLVFTDGLAILPLPVGGVLRIKANDDLTYTAAIHHGSTIIKTVAYYSSAHELQARLYELVGEPTQSHQTEPKAPEKGLNLSQSAQATQVGGDHYSKLAIQPMRYSMVNGLDPLQHTIIKYVTRFRDKGGLQDLDKAKHCIEMLIEHEQSINEMAFKHTLGG